MLPLGLVISALMARMLSPDDMGSFVFAQSIVLSGVVVAQLGLGPTAVRMIAAPLGTGDLVSVRDSVINLLQWGLVGAIGTAVILNFVGTSIGLPSETVIWVSLWIVVLATQKLLAEILRGFHDIRAAALIGDASAGGLISYAVSAALLLFAWWIYRQMGLVEALVLTVAAGAVAIFWAFILLNKNFRAFNLPKGKGNRNFPWRLLWVALPVLVHTIATILLNQSGIWILEAFRPSSEVALYGVAVRLVALIAVPLNIVNSVVSPMISQLFWQGEQQKLERILRALATLSSLPAIAALIAFILIGQLILGLLFGEFYRSAENLLLLLTVGNVINVMAGSCGLTLIMTGHQKTLMFISIITGILTVVSALLVTERFGAIGVATVVTLNLLLKNALMLLSNKHLTGIWTHATLSFDRELIGDLLS